MNFQERVIMNYDDIYYKKSCLAQVIIRLDFHEFIETSILSSLDLEKEVLKYFPKKGMQQLIRFQIMNVISDLKESKAKEISQEGIQQEFSTPDGNKMILSNKFFILEINQYTNFESILMSFKPVLKTLFNKKQLTSMRTGIRYINFFGEKGLRPQKNYFVSPVGLLLETKQEGINCIRSMAMNEYFFDDMHLNFRFGMYNPQYPQIMKKSNYVLDYDCFCDEAIVGYDSIISHIISGHDIIQRMFEKSITEQLRKVMLNE